jgi:hypothetical protein
MFWDNNGEDMRHEQIYHFQPEALKPQLELAHLGRRKELDEAVAKFKKDILSPESLKAYDEYISERKWYRLFIRRSPKCTIPTGQEIEALTEEQLKHLIKLTTNFWYEDGYAERCEQSREAAGNIGVYAFQFCRQQRTEFYDTWKTGSKWIKAWYSLRDRLAGPPPAELVQVSGVVLASVQYYADLVKPSEA